MYMFESQTKAMKIAVWKKRIENFRAQLAESDYKVIKCAECSMIGEELPYDLAALHTERQSIRDQINALEQKILLV